MSETTSAYTAGDRHPSPLEVAVGRLDQATAKVDDLREGCAPPGRSSARPWPPCGLWPTSGPDRGSGEPPMG